MIHYWDKSERFEGLVYHGNIFLGTVKFTFYWNRFRTENMRVEIFDGAIVLQAVDRFTDQSVTISCKYGDLFKYEFELNVELISSKFGVREEIIYCPVNKFTSFETLEKGVPKRLYSSIEFPLIKTTETPYGALDHSNYGHFYGRLAEDNTAKLEKKIIRLSTDIGEIELEDNFQFFDSKKSENHLDFFPSKIMTKHSMLHWTKELCGDKEAENAQKAFQVKVGKILSLLSISERDRIDWYGMNYETYGEDGKGFPLEIIRTYKYAGHPTKKLRHNNFKNKDLHSFLVTVLQKFEGISKKRQNEILKLSQNFQIANLAKTFEDSFIRWHSCLDFLRDKFGCGGRNISKELFRAFEVTGIPLNDIIDAERLTQIKSNNVQFEFTILRNDYVHSGFNAFTGKYQFAINQRRIMRAMAERLLLHRLGIDYRETHLGKVDV